MSARLKSLLANLRALHDHDPPEAEEPERATAAALRDQSEHMHHQADDADGQARVDLRVGAVELWAAAAALVPEERVRPALVALSDPC